MSTPSTFKGFIQPSPFHRSIDFKDLRHELNIQILSGHRANFSSYTGINSIFDEIINDLDELEGYEDQCSTQYYVDLFHSIRNSYGEFDRVVEVGVFMGGASSIIGGCAKHMNLSIDLVDISEDFLRFSYERILRINPELEGRVRMFHGSLPEYVRDVLLIEPPIRFMLQHDGAHDFNQVVRDLASLYYVRDMCHSIAIQDTHLRGKPKLMNFVDAAVISVFGLDLKFSPIGTSYPSENSIMCNPNIYQGNYFLPNRAEGMHLRLADNIFEYPHPQIKLEDFFEF